MITRRIFAAIFDFIIALIPVYMNIMNANYDINFIFYRALLLYIIHTSITLSIMKITIGERILCIKLKSIKDEDLSIFILIIRNLTFTLFLLIIIISINILYNFIIAVILFLSLNGMLFIKNKYGQPMTAIDFLFKTYYTKC